MTTFPELPIKRQLSVYFAACLHHAAIGLKISADWPEFTWTSVWPQLVGRIPDRGELASEFWLQDIRAVNDSDVVLLYAEPGDPLRGALVEAGACLGNGQRVFAVGDNALFGTWQFHPGVARFVTLEGAWRALRIMAAG